jgi:thiol-disulfide isomerase/thioredoxin
MDNNLFVKNILILIFCVILIHLFLNDFLANSSCSSKKEEFHDVINNNTIIINNLDDDNKNENKTKVYLFYADWCGHCKHYKPIFNEFKDKVIDDKNIVIIEVNADDDIPDKNTLYRKYDVDGFPTTIIEKNNNMTKLVGRKSIDELMDAVYSKTDRDCNKTNQESFQNTNNNNDTIIYNFNTTWCSHSKNFEPTWNKFSDSLKHYENVKAIDVKCDLDENIDFCSKFNIKTVPTIIISRNNELKPYIGPRTLEGLMSELNLNDDNNSDNELDNKVKLSNVNNGMNFMLLEDENIKTKVYNFNTSWCRYSVDFQPEWNTFSNSLKSSDGIKAIDVKCDDDKNKELCQKFNVPGYPTVVIESGDGVSIYNGTRTSQSLRKYLGLN